MTNNQLVPALLSTPSYCQPLHTGLQIASMAQYPKRQAQAKFKFTGYISMRAHVRIRMQP